MMNTESEIKSYIESKENIGALLVTGKWGCGKTYLLKKISDSYKSSEKYCIIFCSLFGIDSIQTIEKTIKQELLFSGPVGDISENNRNWLGKGKKAAQGLLSISSEVPTIAPFAKGIGAALSVSLLDFVDIKRNVKKGKSSAELVIVFDDFERCGVDVVDLMGAINSFSEGKGIKTIIIADEEHISDQRFKEFKEKVISRTIRLTNDYEVIASQVINGYQEAEKGYVDFLKENFSLVIEAFDESESNNIRSLKACIIDFERFYAAWNSIGGLSNKDLARVMYDFFAICYEIKAGRYIEDENYGFAFADKNIKDRYKSWEGNYKLYSLTDWATIGEWSQEKTKDEIVRRFMTSEYPVDKKLLSYFFWDLDWKIICEGLPIVLRKGYAGELAADEEIKLIQTLYALVTYNVPFPCEVDYKMLLSGWAARVKQIVDGAITEPDRRTFIDNDTKLRKVDEDLHLLYRNIEMMDRKRYAYSTRLSLVTCYATGDIIGLSRLKHQTVPSFDKQLMDLFETAYFAGDNSTKRELLLSLKDLCFTDKDASTFVDMKESISNLTRTHEDLKAYCDRCQDEFTKCVVRETIKCIPEIIDKIQTTVDAEKGQIPK